MAPSMLVGFKSGPKTWNEWKTSVLDIVPELCEIWFRLDKAAEYEGMLTWLKNRDVKIGLHHWGLAAGKYKTNLATDNEEIRQETVQQIKGTIDFCAAVKGMYVNVHPGAAQVEEFNIDNGVQRPISGERTDSEESGSLFLTAAQDLGTYAKAKGVVLTFETLPAREMYRPNDRSHCYDPRSVPLDVMAKLGAQGNWLANDITHTLAMLCVLEHDDRQRWELFMNFTRQSAPFTRLLHINTLVPPYNGTDSHDGLTEGDFARGVVPWRRQILEILRLFKNRNGVCAIPEPRTDMLANFRALQALMRSI